MSDEKNPLDQLIASLNMNITPPSYKESRPNSMANRNVKSASQNVQNVGHRHHSFSYRARRKPLPTPPQRSSYRNLFESKQFIPYQPKQVKNEIQLKKMNENEAEKNVLMQSIKNKYIRATSCEQKAAIILQKYTRKWLAKRILKKLSKFFRIVTNIQKNMTVKDEISSMKF